MSYGTEAPRTPQAKLGTAKAFGGRVTKDIELRTTQNGNTVVNIDFAMDMPSGNSQFAQVTYWGTDANIAADFLAKGSPISGTGKAYFENWTSQDGSKSGQNLKYDGYTLNLSAKETAALIGVIVKRDIEIALAALKTPVAMQETQAPAPQAQAPVQQQAPAAPVVQDEPVLDITADDLPF